MLHRQGVFELKGQGVLLCELEDPLRSHQHTLAHALAYTKDTKEEQETVS